jgi:hypothetical protein
MRTGVVDVRPSAWVNRNRSIRSPGNAIRKLTSRTPLPLNDAGSVASSEWSVQAGRWRPTGRGKATTAS